MDRGQLTTVFPDMLAQMAELVSVCLPTCHDADLARMQLKVRDTIETIFTMPPYVSRDGGRNKWIEAMLRQAIPTIVEATYDTDCIVMQSKMDALIQKGPDIAALILSDRQSKSI